MTHRMMDRSRRYFRTIGCSSILSATGEAPNGNGAANANAPPRVRCNANHFDSPRGLDDVENPGSLSLRGKHFSSVCDFAQTGKPHAGTPDLRASGTIALHRPTVRRAGIKPSDSHSPIQSDTVERGTPNRSTISA